MADKNVEKEASEAAFRDHIRASLVQPGNDPYNEEELDEMCRVRRARAEILEKRYHAISGEDVSVFISPLTNPIDAFFDGLPLPQLPSPPPTDPVLQGDPVNTYNGTSVCTTSTYRTGISAIQLAALAPNSDTLFPGMLVGGNSIYSGVLSPLPLRRGRAEITLICPSIATSAGGGLSVSVRTPDVGSINNAITSLLKANLGGKTINAVTGAITISTYQSLEQAAMLLSARASWMNGNVSNTLRISSSSSKTNIIISIVQSYYDLLFGAPQGPSDFFNGINLAEIKAALGNTPVQPAFVSTIRYGRMLLIHASSSADEKTLSDALHIAIGGITASGQTDLTVEQASAIRQTSFSMAVLGDQTGTSEVIGGLAAIQHIGEVWNAGTTLKPGAPVYPISYQLRWLGRDPISGDRYESARLSLISDYSTTNCRPQAITKFGVRFQTTNDDKDDSSTVRAYLFSGNELVATNKVDSPYNNTWDNGDSSPHPGDAGWGGPAGWFCNADFNRPISSSEISQFRLRVTKSGTDGWTFKPSACVWLEHGEQVEFLPFPSGGKHLENDENDAWFPG